MATRWSPGLSPAVAAGVRGRTPDTTTPGAVAGVGAQLMAWSAPRRGPRAD